MDHEKSEGSGGSSMGRSFLQKLPLKRLSSSELPDGKRRNTWASGAPFRANVLPLTTNNLFRECNEKLATLAQNQRQIVEWTTLIGEFEQVKNDYLARNQLEEFKLNLYIPVEGMADPHDSNRFDLLEAVQTFLSDAVSQKVCLIQGTAGSGKSTFTHHLAHRLWSEYDKASNQATAVVPLFISLFRVYMSGMRNRDLIAAFFAKQGFREDQIQLVRRQREFVFLLDGYDEIERQDRNFFIENELDLWNAKVIITSRPEYLRSGYRSKFYPPGQPQLLQEYWIAPFSKSNIQQYISQYLMAKPNGHSVNEYEHYVLRPDICALISNPFLLRMIMTVTPAQDRDNLKRGDLYQQFIDYWLENAQARLDKIQLPQDHLQTYSQLYENNFKFQARLFCQKFALALYRHQLLEASYQPIDIFQDYNSPQDQMIWQKFLANDPKIHLLRSSSPLIRQGHAYRFLHKSLRDYLVAESLWQDKSLVQCKDDAIINQFHLADDPGILDFIVERAKYTSTLQDNLLNLVERSKTDANFSTASANAITILVRAGRRFGGHDLRGIRIPGADISGGWFECTQFQNADLREVRFHQAWLRKANFGKACMNSVSFGERPYLEQTHAVSSVAFSPDGQLLASGSDLDLFPDWRGNMPIAVNDNTVRLWSVQRQEVIHIFEGHHEFVNSVAFSPDGQLLASGSHDDTVRLWSVQRQEVIHIFEGHHEFANSVAFSPDGQLLASGSMDRTVRLWSVQRQEVIHIFEGHHELVNSVAFSPDGQLLASGSDDRTVRLWSVQRQEVVHIFEGHDSEVYSVAFSPDGQLLASGSRDETVRLWSVQRQEVIHTIDGHDSWVESVAFSPDGQLLASGSSDTVRLWSLQRQEFIHIFYGHHASVHSVAFSPDGQLLASGSEDKTVRLWSVQRQEVIHIFDQSVKSAAISPDGQLLASGSGDNTVRQRSAQHQEVVRIYEDKFGSIGAFDYSPDGQLLAAAVSKTVRLWSFQHQKIIHTFGAHNRRVECVAFSPDGQLLACGDWGTVRLWSVQRGEVVHIFEDPNNVLERVVFSPDGQLIAACGRRKTIRLLSVQHQEIIHTFEDPNSVINRVVFSPDGQLLASYGRYPCSRHATTLRLWSVQRLEIIHIFEGHNRSINSIAFSPDGQLLASCSDDCTVRLWSVSSGKAMAHMTFYDKCESITWDNIARNPYLITIYSSHANHLCQVQLKGGCTPDNHSLDFTCQWALPQNRLVLMNANIQGATGLDSLNLRLLRQHSAVGEPAVLHPICYDCEEKGEEEEGEKRS